MTSAVTHQGLNSYEQVDNVSAEASSATWSYSEAVALPHLQASLPSDSECGDDVLMMVTLILMIISWILLKVVTTIRMTMTFPACDVLLRYVGNWNQHLVAVDCGLSLIP